MVGHHRGAGPVSQIDSHPFRTRVRLGGEHRSTTHTHLPLDTKTPPNQIHDTVNGLPLT